MSKAQDDTSSELDDGSALLERARGIVRLATELGAEEVRASAGRSISTELTRRDGRIEKAEESRSLGVRVSMMVDGRWSAHSTSDLRPDALREFLTRAVDATRFLEPDPNRRLTDRELMGSADAALLEPWDDAWEARDPGERRTRLAALEAGVREAGSDVEIRSVTSFIWDGASQRAIVTSHGFESAWRSTSFGHGVVLSLVDEGGRLPEAYDSCGARHFADLLDVDLLAKRAVERGRHRLGSGPAPSGRYPMLVDNRLTGRILGVLLGPMSGELLYEKRSCLEGRLGTKVASPALTIIDDPLIPRASGSKPHDGDGLPSRRRTLIDEGVLQEYFIDIYNSRRLGVAPTGDSTGNLIVPPGDRSPLELLADLPQAIRVEGFLGGNANPTSGDFSFGISGVLYEKGQPVRNVSEMNISGNLFDFMERFTTPADDVWTWSWTRTPSLLFDDVQFSGS